VLSTWSYSCPSSYPLFQETIYQVCVHISEDKKIGRGGGFHIWFGSFCGRRFQDYLFKDTNLPGRGRRPQAWSPGWSRTRPSSGGWRTAALQIHTAENLIKEKTALTARLSILKKIHIVASRTTDT
jgi:hypothetical protein